MPFQFYCPQGHLLEGHESQMGQQGQCPMCGAMFMFPMMGGPPAAPTMTPGQMPGAYAGQGYSGQGFPGQGFSGQGMPGQQGMPGHGFPGQPGGFPQQPPGFGPPNFGGGDRFAGVQEAASQGGYAPLEAEAPPEPRIFRILCPKGHELQTPEDMLGTQALCPYCNTQMELRYEDSVEYKKQQELEQRIRDEQTARFWMKMAIWGSILVGAIFVGLICWMFMR
jgi:hypothetical protein